MIESISESLPIIIIGIYYFTRIERKIAEINVDLTWIKKFIEKCLPTSDDHT